MVFFSHHRLVTRRMVRKIMNAAQPFIEEQLAELTEIGFLDNSDVKPQLETIKTRIFLGLRANGFKEASVAALEAACNGWWGGAATEPGMRVYVVAAWQEATQVDTWCLVSPFLRAAAPVMHAAHLRNLDKGCVGISELECAFMNTDFVVSGAQLSWGWHGLVHWRGAR
jgi:hypothetical protein